jgi:hypothetical protein
MATTSVTVAEIRYGIKRLPEGRRKEVLLATATEIFSEFADRVMAFDIGAADRCADIVSRRDQLGPPLTGSTRRSPRSPSRPAHRWPPAM